MGRKNIDRTGKKYNKLLVIEEAGKDTKGNFLWKCQCDCGKIITVSGKNLNNGDVKSCGCLRDGHPKHGLVYTPTYEIWCGMKKRCTNPNCVAWKNYGGRGITLCERWMKFENFYADMGERPEGLSIDRIDNNGNYEPGNCRWATNTEQANNTRQNHYLTYKGETKTIKQWAKEFNMLYSTLCGRIINYKWPIEKALTEPLYIGGQYPKA
jgi:hypothetical protein